MITVTVKVTDDRLGRETEIEMSDSILSPASISVDRYNQVDLLLNSIKHRVSRAYNGSLS